MKLGWKLIHYWYLFIGLVAIISVVAGFIFPPGHEEEFWWSGISFFFALIGFIGCVLIVIVAKGLGYWLHRKENYYD